MDKHCGIILPATESLRIAFCLPQLTGGADLLQQIQIVKGLKERGHQLTFVAPRDHFDTICTQDLQVQTLARRTWSKSGWFNFLRRTTWKFQKALGIPYLNLFSNYSMYDACLQCLPGHDVVQERNGLYRMAVAMACKRLRLPYILFFDADDIFEQDFQGEPIRGLLRRRAKAIIRFTVSTADGILTVSEATKRRLVEVWEAAEEKIAVFPNAVNVHQHRPQPEMREKIRTALGIGDQPLVIYVGGFYLWHDVSTLIEAFAQVRQKHPEARLLLVGDGKQRQDVTRRVEDQGIASSVQFTGTRPHEEIPYLVSAADVAVAPYPKMEHTWWGSSMKLFEYMASGTALVASNVGEQVSEVVKDGENGLLAAPGDPQALADTLVKLIEEPALRARLGQQARQDALQKYSWECYLERLEKVYAAVRRREPISAI